VELVCEALFEADFMGPSSRLRSRLPVDRRAIAEIQDRVEADGLIRLHKAVFEPGTRISIQAGPFEGMLGRVEAECDDRRRVAILLETLWQARVVIEKQWVRAEAA